MDLKDLIKSDRPDIKENSLNAYLISLRKMNQNKEIENLTFLKDYDNIIEFLGKFKLPTKRNYISSILVVLRAYNKSTYDEVLQKYREYLTGLNTEYNSEINTHEKSMKQKNNWATLSDLKKGLRLYQNQIRDLDLLNKAKLNTKQINIIQSYLVVALYTLQPPVRLNYANMKIIKNLSEVEDGKNYLLNKSRNIKSFIFQDYKTSGKHGKITQPIGKELNTIINKWLKVNTTNNFLIDQKGNTLNANQLGKFISKAFAFTGKKITLNLLRHIYISENIDLEAIKKSKELAKSMHHSTGMQEMYAKV
tara:strand:+ start:1 stop:921 length:921 start_codon:yes stop_codon:yes gene_type:complete